MSSRNLNTSPTIRGDTECETLPENTPDSFFLGSPIVRAYDDKKRAGATFWAIPRNTGENYRRVRIDVPALTDQEQEVARKIRYAIGLREKWVYEPRKPQWCSDFEDVEEAGSNSNAGCPTSDSSGPVLHEKLDIQCSWRQGVMSLEGHGDRGLDYEMFVQDMEQLMRIVEDPESRSFCWRRLALLLEKFHMYVLLNADEEQLSLQKFPHRDFYNCVKIDTHVHHSSLANQKHLLSFIKDKLRNHGDDVVLANRDDPNGDPLTLKQVFDSIHLTANDLSVDTLDVHADQATFHRFDRFSTKYNPIGQSRLREIFMKTDNFNGGQYLAELTKEVLNEQAKLKYQLSEYRVSIYGRYRDEWDKLGLWFKRHGIYSDMARWLIQIPRLYSSYKEKNLVASFEEMLMNIFVPAFEATIDPASHPEVYVLLQQVVGFDSVDDESIPQIKLDLKDCVPPSQWTSAINPPYAYYQYYIQANLAVLNKLREQRGLNTLSYRPHCGEAGPLDHLACSFLLANGINHGIKLKESPVLQYLYYLTQIGIAMSPLSNAALFVEYAQNPCMSYFRRGLNVSLSTDDPLQFAYTREPLLEELSVFASVFRCSNTDLCELARNSVLQSGFETRFKRRWLGPKWYLADWSGNDPSKSNVPNMRLRYRYETIVQELSFAWNNGDVPRDIRTLPTWHERSDDDSIATSLTKRNLV